MVSIKNVHEYFLKSENYIIFLHCEMLYLYAILILWSTYLIALILYNV